MYIQTNFLNEWYLTERIQVTISSPAYPLEEFLSMGRVPDIRGLHVRRSLPLGTLMTRHSTRHPLEHSQQRIPRPQPA